MKIRVRKLFKDSAVIFVAGTIFSVAVELAIGIPAERYIGIFFAFVSLFILYTAITFGVTREEISSQIKQLGLTSFWIYEPTHGKATYEKAKEFICSAKHRILVLSHYTPTTLPLDFPANRVDYLIKGIEEVISSHLSEPAAEAFTYKRILQSDNAKASNGILQPSHMEDGQTFEHCDRVLKLLEGQSHGSVNAEFKLSEPIPSFPSMLIVDDRYLLFAFATKSPKLAKKGQKLEFAGAIFIEDRDGKTVQAFKSIFDNFWQDSYPIYDVDKSSSSSKQEQEARQVQ